MNPLLFLSGMSLKTWGIVGVALVVVGLGLAVKVQTHRLETAKAETAAVQAKFDDLLAKVEAAQKAREKDIVDRYVITTKQEAEHAKRYANLDSRYRAAIAAARVRPEANSSGDGALPLSAAAASLGCPDRAADAAGRLAELEGGILAILERCDKAIERTITCKAWLDSQMVK